MQAIVSVGDFPCNPPSIVLSGGDKPRSPGQCRERLPRSSKIFSLDCDHVIHLSSVLLTNRREPPINKFNQFVGERSLNHDQLISIPLCWQQREKTRR